MANVILSDCNIPMRRIDWEDTTKGLGLAKTLTAAQTLTSNVIELLAPKALKFLLLVGLTSGHTHFYLARHAGTPDFTPGADCIDLDISDADSNQNLHCLWIDTTVAKPYISVQAVDSGAGTTIKEAVLFGGDLMPAGGGYHEFIGALNGLPVDNGQSLAAYSNVLA